MGWDPGSGSVSECLILLHRISGVPFTAIARLFDALIFWLEPRDAPLRFTTMTCSYFVCKNSHASDIDAYIACSVC